MSYHFPGPQSFDRSSPSGAGSFARTEYKNYPSYHSQNKHPTRNYPTYSPVQTQHRQPLYPSASQGSTSSYKRASGSHESQPAHPKPSSRQCPPTSNTKLFGRQDARHYDAAPPPQTYTPGRTDDFVSLQRSSSTKSWQESPSSSRRNAGCYDAAPAPRPRSSSHGQSWQTGASTPLQCSSSTRSRRESHSSSKQPTEERSHRAYGVSSETRDTFCWSKNDRSSYQVFTEVFDADDDVDREYQRKPYHYESSVPYGEQCCNHTSSRRCPHAAGSSGERPSGQTETEIERLERATTITLLEAEAAFAQGTWRSAADLYGRLESELRRLSSIERQLGRPGYKVGQRQAEKAAEYKERAMEKWLSWLEYQYEHHMAEARAFTHGAGKNLLMADASYVGAIMFLAELGELSPNRLQERFPGRIDELKRRLRKLRKAGHVDEQSQTKDKDGQVVNAVRGFIGEFHLVEKLIAQGEGVQARHQFNKAKKTLADTLLSLPERFVPAKEWRDKMAGAIKDQEKRAKERFGKDW